MVPACRRACEGKEFIQFQKEFRSLPRIEIYVEVESPWEVFLCIDWDIIGYGGTFEVPICNFWREVIWAILVGLLQFSIK